ncbi:hypothetical protein PMIT1342_02643 [Prochlorococcus marinus str. MIT 1342]|nr:hypothetical protein PMIT1342_02643 [Prochlorococcus marinus str. MIT 1342]
MNLPHVSALFTDPDSQTSTLTKQDLKKDIWDAYQASQSQLKQAKEEIIPAAIFGGLVTLLLIGALTN